MNEFELAIQWTSKCLRWPAVATYNTNTNTNTNTDTRLALSCPWLSLSASAPRILGVGAAQTWPAASEPRKAKGRKDRRRQADAANSRKEGTATGGKGSQDAVQPLQWPYISDPTFASSFLFFLFPPLPLLPLRASPRASPRYQIKVSYSDDLRGRIPNQ